MENLTGNFEHLMLIKCAARTVCVGTEQMLECIESSPMPFRERIHQSILFFDKKKLGVAVEEKIKKIELCKKCFACLSFFEKCMS